VRQKPVMEAWVGRSQAAAIRCAMRGEEGGWFRAKIAEIQAVLDAAPVTYETEGLGDARRVVVHYFGPSVDVWLVELDRGAALDAPEDYQSQAYGYTALYGLGWEGAEAGWVCLPEILAAGLELDLHWTPKTVAEMTEKA
jgi:hypothetical protein